MSKLQLLVGSDSPFLNLKFLLYAKWIEHSWLTSLWQCTSRTGFVLKIKRAWTSPLKRLNDRMLMDYFLSLKFKPSELQTLNKWRIYLQVLTLSDIVSADGKFFIPMVLNGIQLVDRKSSLDWPVQQCPPQQAWRLWASALQHLHQGSHLLKPLMSWISTPISAGSGSWIHLDQPSSIILLLQSGSQHHQFQRIQTE